MRSVMIAGVGLMIAAPGAADAQRVVQHGPGAGYGMPGRTMAPNRPVMPNRPVIQGPVRIHTPHQGGWQQRPVGRPIAGQQGGRWGSKVGGRWWGGANAPGGWSAYRRPYRGWAVPAYWNAPRFYISDWSNYGLAQPQPGYNWARYYDDAILIDGRGSVYDTVGGLDWDGGYAGYDAGYDGSYEEDARVYAGADDRGYAAPYPPRYDDRRRDSGRDTGLGGAAIGAVAGGVAGNLIAGRGNRLGGTLIGAGVGAAAGYAIDKNEDRGRRGRPPVAPDYGAGYAQPGYGAGYPGGYAQPGYGAGYVQPVPHQAAPGGRWVSPDGATTVTTTTAGGYVGGGYYQPGGTTTTVVVQNAPVVTTTTTEIYEDAVTYSRPAVRTWKKKVWRPKAKCLCR